MGPIFAYAPNAWSLFLIAPAVVSFWLAFETVHKKYGRLGKMFALLTFSLGWWSLTYALELGSVREEAMRFWLKAEYFGIPLVVPMMYLILREFLGMRKLRRSLLIGIWIVPVTTFVLQTTNEFHHLFYESVEVVGNGNREWLSLRAGPWYVIDAIYICFLGVLAIVHLVRRFPPKAEAAMRKQFSFVLIAIIFPYAGFFLYLGDWFWEPDIDLTTYFFLFSGFLLGIGIFWFQLFDLLPVALEKVFEKIGDSCLVFDYHGRLVKANRSAKRLLGWSNTPMGMAHSEVFEPIPALFRTLELEDGESVRVTMDSNAGERFLVVSRNNIEDSRHHRAGYLLVIRDDTEQLRLEKELRNSNAEKDKLFSVIGHDLRGSLAGLVGLSDVLSQPDTDLSSDESKDLLKTMKESAAATSTFLENLLFWARMERGDYSREASRFPIKDAMRDVRSAMAATLTNKNVVLQEETEDDLELETDRTLLEIALRNLISNAVKFSPEGSTVRISIDAEPGDQVRFEVSDRGIGIPQKMLDSLWDVNGRNGREGTHGEPSSGLGLVLVREAVESMEGVIEVESEVGKGTSFRFRIPRVFPVS